MTDFKRLTIVTGTRNPLHLVGKETVAAAILSAAPKMVLVGDCPTGVDLVTRELCKRNRILYILFRANWDAHGRAAGPIRNGRMVRFALKLLEQDIGWDANVLAFPAGRSPGTRDCMNQARRAGLLVTEIGIGSMLLEIEGGK